MVSAPESHPPDSRRPVGGEKASEKPVTHVTGASAGIGRSPRVQRLTSEALAYAAKDGRTVVDIPDVLLALISDPGNASLLSELGIDAVAVRDALRTRRDS